MENQNKTNKQNPKSSPIVLKEAWVSQAYCGTTDFQTLVNFPDSKEKKSSLKYKVWTNKMSDQRKNYPEKLYHTLAIACYFCHLWSSLQIAIAFAYFMKRVSGEQRREEKHQPCDPFLQNTLHPFQTFLGGPASLLILGSFWQNICERCDKVCQLCIINILYSKGSGYSALLLPKGRRIILALKKAGQKFPTTTTVLFVPAPFSSI